MQVPPEQPWAWEGARYVGYAGTGGGVPMWEGRVGKGQGRPLKGVPSRGQCGKGGKGPGTPSGVPGGQPGRAGKSRGRPLESN